MGDQKLWGKAVENVISTYQKLVEEKDYELRGQADRLKKLTRILEKEEVGAEEIKVQLAAVVPKFVAASVAGYDDGAKAGLDVVERNSEAEKTVLISKLGEEFEKTKGEYGATKFKGYDEETERIAENLIHYRIEGYFNGFKDAAETLIALRFESSGTSQIPHELLEKLSNGIDQLVENYRSQISKEGYEFSHEEEKKNDYKAALKETKLEDVEVEKKLQEWRQSIVTGTAEAYKTGAKAALECVVNHHSVDKGALLIILGANFETLKPFFVKTLEREDAEKMAEFKKTGADGHAEAALGTSILYLTTYRAGAYEMGFKESANYLVTAKFASESEEVLDTIPEKDRREFTTGIKELSDSYRDRFSAPGVKFRYQDEKLKEYKAALEAAKKEEKEVPGLLEAHQRAIVKASHDTYIQGTKAALDCLVSCYDLPDKATTLANMSVAFRALQPSFLKELRSEIDAKIEEAKNDLEKEKKITGEDLKVALAAEAEVPLAQLKYYREEAYVNGFKDAAEYLVGLRFKVMEDSFYLPAKQETEEHKELRVGIEKLVRDYEEKVERKQFKFRLEDHKLKAYEKALIKETTNTDLLREKLEVHRNEIVSSSQKAYQSGAYIALNCILENMDLDKQSLVANLDVAFNTWKPSLLKEIKTEVEAKTASFRRQATANGTLSDDSVAAFSQAMENISYYREEAHDLGFKDAAEFLLAQWQSQQAMPPPDEEDEMPSSPRAQSRKYAQDLAIYKKQNETLQKKIAALQKTNEQLEAQLRDYSAVKKKVVTLEAELSKLKQSSPTTTPKKLPK